MRKDEKGYIVVETLIAFTLYLLAILSILSLVNISVVQSRVHYAVTEACESVAMYSYVFQATGQAKHITGMSGKAETAEANAQTVVENLNQIINSAQSLDLSGVKGGVQGAIQASSRIRVKDVLAMMVQSIKDSIFAECMNTLSHHYLDNYDSNGSVKQTGEEYLKANNVKDTITFNGNYGIGFNDYNISLSLGEGGSQFLDKKGDITVAISYEIDYRFGGLKLPFTTLKIRQVVKTKAWLNGDGDGYK